MVKSVLVTGCAGFIGSNLVGHFLRKGYRVLGVDNLICGDRENVNEYLQDERFEFVEGDLQDYQLCLKCTSEVEAVVHQAALGSVPRSIATPLSTHAHNVTAFMNILEASRVNGVKRFVYASSSSVYGDDLELPKVEARTGNALSPYAVSKQVDELYARNYARVYGMETIGLRYFNVFGPTQSPQGSYAAVIPLLMNSILTGKQFTVFGNGEQSRDFTYVDNVLDANEKALETKDSRAFGDVFNIAAGGRTTLNELITKVKEVGHDQGVDTRAWKPAYGPDRMGDVRNSCADVSHSKKILNFTPSIGLDHGLSLTLAHYLSKDNEGLKASA